MTDQPKGQFIKMPRSLLESEAYRGLGINGHRVVLFLLLEHMRKGGKKNGELKAPYRQLAEFGVNGHVRDAINDVERRGLILCNRAYRTATTYTLTWLGLPGGKMPEEPWKTYRDPALQRGVSGRKRKNLRADQPADGSKSAGRSACRPPNLRADQPADAGEICGQISPTYLEKNSNQGGHYTRYREGAGPVVVPLRPAAEGGR